MNEEKNIVLEVLAILIIVVLSILIATIIYLNIRSEKSRQIFADKVNSIYDFSLYYYQNNSNNLEHYILKNGQLISESSNKVIHEDEFWMELSGNITIQTDNNDIQIILDIQNDKWQAVNKDYSSDLIISKN